MRCQESGCANITCGAETRRGRLLHVHVEAVAGGAGREQRRRGGGGGWLPSWDRRLIRMGACLIRVGLAATVARPIVGPTPVHKPATAASNHHSSTSAASHGGRPNGHTQLASAHPNMANASHARSTKRYTYTRLSHGGKRESIRRATIDAWVATRLGGGTADIHPNKASIHPNNAGTHRPPP